MDLVFLDSVVAEDFSDQRAPDQLRVSVFDLGEGTHQSDVRLI